MKKMIKNSFVVVALVLMASYAQAGEPYVRVKEKGSKEFFLFIDESDISREGTVISLKSLRGSRIYNEKLKAEADYTKVYDLNRLRKGQYVLEIEDGSKVTIYSLEISKDGLQLEKLDQPELVVASSKK